LHKIALKHCNFFASVGSQIIVITMAGLCAGARIIDFMQSLSGAWNIKAYIFCSWYQCWKISIRQAININMWTDPRSTFVRLLENVMVLNTKLNTNNVTSMGYRPRIIDL